MSFNAAFTIFSWLGILAGKDFASILVIDVNYRTVLADIEVRGWGWLPALHSYRVSKQVRPLCPFVVTNSLIRG